MTKNKELLILSHLRQDSRKNLVKISKETGIPLSTVFDKASAVEKKYVDKYTTLIDFSKLGFNLRVFFIVKGVVKGEGDRTRRFFKNNLNINSISKLKGGDTYFVEALFSSLKGINNFVECLQSTGVSLVNQYHVVEELKKEEWNVARN